MDLGSLESDSKEQTVASHSRQQYPGQTENLTQVKGFTRRVMQNTVRRHSNALPGQSIILANNDERRQFMLSKGTINDAWTLFKASTKVQFWFYAHSGVRYCIPQKTTWINNR